MKELSIEAKAKLYDEAIIRGSRLWESDMITRENYEYIFPELKESEDEEIKEMLKVAVERTPWMQDKKEKCYEWLEVQGEQKTVDDLTQQEAMDIAVAKCFEQGEQKPVVIPKFKVGQTIKKEGFNLEFTIIKIEDGFYCNDMGYYFPFTDQDDWELVEQNSAWSEEDEDYYDAIIAKLEVTQDDALLTDNQMKFLKSLKERYTWKPSDLQIAYLSKVIFTLGNEGDCATAAELRELRDNLEMLKEK